MVEVNNNEKYIQATPIYKNEVIENTYFEVKHF